MVGVGRPIVMWLVLHGRCWTSNRLRRHSLRDRNDWHFVYAYPFFMPQFDNSGCGACVVLISKYDPATDEVTEFSASSCLTLLHSVDRCSVITSEGIGNTKDGYHAVQQRLAGFHASQCGFCTPGMCMSIFSTLSKADKKSGRPDPPAGFSKIIVSKAERAVSGNLCRCTGYRPIVDAYKSFSANVDLEDLGINCFWKKGNEPADVNKLPSYNSGAVCTFPEFLKSEIKSSVDQANVALVTVSDDGWYLLELICKAKPVGK